MYCSDCLNRLYIYCQESSTVPCKQKNRNLFPVGSFNNADENDNADLFPVGSFTNADENDNAELISLYLVYITDKYKI